MYCESPRLIINHQIRVRSRCQKSRHVSVAHGWLAPLSAAARVIRAVPCRVSSCRPEVRVKSSNQFAVRDMFLDIRQTLSTQLSGGSFNKTAVSRVASCERLQTGALRPAVRCNGWCNQSQKQAVSSGADVKRLIAQSECEQLASLSPA
jgi:hypothetical protein